jgi:hypothetical protein
VLLLSGIARIADDAISSALVVAIMVVVHRRCRAGIDIFLSHIGFQITEMSRKDEMRASA